MDNFKVIYKILKHLETALDYEVTDLSVIEPGRLGISRERWEQLLIMMQDDGYITGIITCKALGDDKRHISEPIQPTITIRGMEYLAENSFMKRAANMLRGAVDVIK